MLIKIKCWGIYNATASNTDFCSTCPVHTRLYFSTWLYFLFFLSLGFVFLSLFSVFLLFFAGTRSFVPNPISIPKYLHLMTQYVEICYVDAFAVIFVGLYQFLAWLDIPSIFNSHGKVH